MISFKTAPCHSKSSETKKPKTHVNKKRNVYANIHKCPVNTLLTSIFSGIAWNG